MLAASDSWLNAMRLLDSWWTSRRASTALDLRRTASGSARTRALARLASIAARTPRHERPRVTTQVEMARSIVNATLSAGSERVLGSIVAAALPDDAWLRAIAAFAETHRDSSRSISSSSRSPTSVSEALIGLILLVAEPPSPNQPWALLFTCSDSRPSSPTDEDIMWTEFKAFLLKQNILALALAVVIAEATNKLVQAVVNDFVMPVVTLALPDPTQWQKSVLTIGKLKLGWGDFLAVLINFFVIGFVCWRITKMLIKDPKVAAKAAT
jgi:large conductance mechanosensitive channel